jgi:uncharacterized protein YkwD
MGKIDIESIEKKFPRMENNIEKINESWLNVENILKKTINGSNIVEIINLAFGNDLEERDYNTAISLLGSWSQGYSTNLPKIEIRKAAEINHANGAYASAIETIYLSQEFIQTNNINTIAEVILEELGHALDRRLNTGDATGDEGEIFASLILGKTLTAAKLATLKSEDDSAIVNLDGRELEIEQASGFDPSGLEQEMLELINRMRINPATELNILLNTPDTNVTAALSAYKVNLQVLAAQWTELDPVAPVAWSSSLSSVAANHSQMMINLNQQSHQLPGEADLGTRATNAGYGDYSILGENVYAYGKSVFHSHAGFAIDWGNTSTGIQNPAGHRNTIMHSDFREVGISLLGENNPSTAVGPFSVTQEFGSRFSLNNPWLLGVVFKDADGDNFYDNGEGLGGVNVLVRGGQGSFTTQSMTAGGYQLQLESGNYSVTFSGGGLNESITKNFTVGIDNVKVDAISSFTSQLAQLRDFDGNDLGAHDAWKSIGSIDVQGDGDVEEVFVNCDIGRWATLSRDPVTGAIDFSSYASGGDTRIVGIYEDPLIKNGVVTKGSSFDSQTRFQNDLFINNLVLIPNSARDYDRDGLQEIYFQINDGTAVLHAYMHADGNIRYANYQSAVDLADYMNVNNIDSSIWSNWL